MNLNEKSLDELKACNAKIMREIRQKEREAIIADGGFVCTKCGAVTAKKQRHTEGTDLCRQCGYQNAIDEHLAMFASIDKVRDYGTVVYVDPCRTRNELIGDDEQVYLEELIIQIGDTYYFVSADMHSPDDDPTLVLRKIRKLPEYVAKLPASM